LGEKDEDGEPEESEAITAVLPEDGFKEMDTSPFDEELVEFKETCSTLQKDEKLKAASKKMIKSFCVIVLQSSYIPSSGKTYS
jgi:hypothetical protein